MNKILPLLLLLIFTHVHKTIGQGSSDSTDKQSLELLLFFNQPSFAPGDTARFKAYLLGDIHNLVQDRKIMNLGLYKGKKLVHFQRFILNHGESSGCLNLNPSMKGGAYTILAEIDGLQFEGALPVANEYTYGITSISPTATQPLEMNTSFRSEVFKTGELQLIKINAKQELNDVRGGLMATIIQDKLFDKPALWVRLQQGSSSYQKSNFPAFFTGSIVSTAGRNIPDSVKITFFLKNNELIYSLYASPTGEVMFPLFLNFEDDNIFYLISHRFLKTTDLQLRVNKVFEDQVTSEPLKESYSETPDAYWDFSKKRHVIRKSYSFFLQEGNKNTAEKNENEFPGDYEVLLDRYERFTTMHELINTIIPTVKYRKNSKSEWIRVFMKEEAQMATSDPIYIIDGVMTDSTHYFLALDPLKIKSIKILRSADKLRKFGDLGKNGIIIVDSKIPESITVPLSTHSFLVTGITSNATVTNSLPSQPSKIPDTRSCLYWNETLTLSKNNESTLTFNTGNVTGPIKLVVFGISNTGKILYHEEVSHIEFQ